MSIQKSTVCLVCAWRENCLKRFNAGTSETLHCPDFSEDLTLRKSPKESKDSDRSDSAE